MIFEGSGVALVTPFDKEGKVNFLMLKKLIEFQIAGGTRALIVLGTTGEASSVTEDERSEIIRFCVREADGRIPVIVGAGSNSTEIAKLRAVEAEFLGADGLLVVTPYYNKCNQEGLIAHYKAIASSTKLPIILYNVPSRTGVNILPDTVRKLAEEQNIVGIKEASGNIAQIEQMIRTLPPDFPVYSGDDSLTLPLMTLGARGVISVTANCYPDLVSDLCDFALDNDYVHAKAVNDRLYKVNKGLFLDVNPICVKAYMNILGFDVGAPRLPLTEPSPQVREHLEALNK